MEALKKSIQDFSEYAKRKRGFRFAPKINHLSMIAFVGTSLCRGNSE
jgi:hypothetical protein